MFCRVQALELEVKGGGLNVLSGREGGMWVCTQRLMGQLLLSSGLSLPRGEHGPNVELLGYFKGNQMWIFVRSSYYYYFLNLSAFFFFNLFLFIYLFIYLFLAVLGLRFCARAFSICGKWGPLFIAVRRPLTIAASLVAEHRLQTRRLSDCGSRAQLLRGMWDLPRPGLEPVSPALAGGFLTTAPPGKPYSVFLFRMFS